jgi:hypothetical protein
MDWADFVILLIRPWVLVAMSLATFALSVRVWSSCKIVVVDHGYFLTIGAGVLPIAVFYIGSILGWYDGHREAAIAVSRISFAIMFMSINAVLASVARGKD